MTTEIAIMDIERSFVEILNLDNIEERKIGLILKEILGQKLTFNSLLNINRKHIRKLTRGIHKQFPEAKIRKAQVIKALAHLLEKYGRKPGTTLYLNKHLVVPHSPFEKFIIKIGSDPTNKMLYNELWNQLAARNENILSFWADYPKEVQELSIKVAGIVKKHIEWPNPYFLPEDRIDYLFWAQYQFDSLEITEAVVEVENITDVKFSEKEYEKLFKKNLLEYVYAILERL